MNYNRNEQRATGQQYLAGPKSNDSQAMISLVGNTLRIWWFLAMLIGALLAVAAATAVFLTFQPQYKASIWLRIYSDAPYIVFEAKGNSSQFVENQTQLIRSKLVLGSLLVDPEIAGLEELSMSADKIETLANRLVVRPVGRSEYFSVEYYGISAKTSKQVVQRVVDSYMALQNSNEAQQRHDVVTLLESEKSIREQKVERLRDKLAQQVQDAAVDESKQSRFTHEQLSSLSELRKQMVTLDVESAILKIEIQAFENTFDGQKYTPQAEQIRLSVAENAEVRAAEQQIQQLEDQIRINEVYGKDHPITQQIRRQIDLKKYHLARLETKLAQHQSSRSAVAWEISQEDHLATMKSKLESYNITREVLESHIAVDTGEIKKSTGDSLQVEFLRAELRQATEVHDMISRRLLAIKTEQRAPARVQPLESGAREAIPVELMPYKKMAMASVGAFSFPFILLFGLELLLSRVSTVRQLEDSGELHVIGEVASLPRISLMRHLRQKQWSLEKQLYRESVDHVRTCLVCQESQANAQVIAITSSVCGEGKTSLALQLSASLADASGKRVLLIDGDLRHPNAHQWYQTDLSPGLSDVLEKTANWKTIIRRFKADVPGSGGPFLLTAGDLLASPHRLFGGNQFETLLSRLRPHFRYIVIDTPPVLSASESLVMAKAADAVLFVARRDRSRLGSVRSAYERLQLAGVESIGTVLTGVPFRSYSSKYGSYTYPEAARSMLPTVSTK